MSGGRDSGRGRKGGRSPGSESPSGDEGTIIAGDGDARAYAPTEVSEPGDGGDAPAVSPREAGEPSQAGPRDGLVPGDALGRYAILDVLGEGGMGRVYAAHDPVLDRKVALKVLRPGQQVSEDARARLLREARAMAKLSHPNVITVYEVGSVDDTEFVAMELIEGETLAAWIARGPRPWREVAKVFVGAGRALAAAHGAGLVHRDFKPANVLLDGHGRVVVTDFGLARSLRAGERPEPSRPDDSERTPEHDDAALEQPPIRDSGLETLTAAGAVMGTPAYMAPEQHAGTEPDGRTDQFGYCATLYEALYGVRPFAGKSLGEMRRRALSGQVASPQWRTAVPARLRRAVRRGLQPAAGDRHPSMDALLGEIERTLGRRRRQVMALSAGGGSLLIAGAVLLASGDSPASPCGEADGQLAGVWDEAIAADVREAMAAGDPGGGASLATAVERMDAYAAAWRDSYEQLCAATYDRGEVSEDDYLAARGCLTRRRRDLGSLATVFRDADARTLEHAAMAAQSLPRVEDCLDFESLRAGIAPPEGGEIRRSVGAVRDELAELRALWEAGRARDAEAPAEALLERARDIDYGPLVAEALYQQGEIHLALKGVSAAREALEEAAFLAEVEGHDPIRARALVARVDAEARFSSDHDAIARMAERARAAVERGGRDPRLFARMDRALARIYREQGEYDAAEAALAAALARYRAEEGPDSVRAAETTGQLAELHAELGRFEEALELGNTARQAATGTLGDDHPLVVELSVGVARALQALGRYDEARGIYDELEQRLEASAGIRADDGAGRVARGRVVDAAGEPVEGAEVSIGTMIIGDGRYVDAYRGMDAQGSRARRTTTDREGRFELGELPISALTAVAEHDDRGRSIPLPIAAGKRDIEGLALRLAPFGRVKGEVEIHGEPPPVIWIMARPRVDELSGTKTVARLLVRPGEPFVFERLAAGPHVISASTAWQRAQAGERERDVIVRPGETAALDVSFDRRGKDLTVDVRGPGGEIIPSVQVLLLVGRHDYETVAETEQAVRKASEMLARGDLSFAGRPAELQGISAGAYSLCVVPMPIDLKDRELLAKLAPHRGEVPVHCEPIDINDARGEAALTIQVPAAPALDELIEERRAP